MENYLKLGGGWSYLGTFLEVSFLEFFYEIKKTFSLDYCFLLCYNILIKGLSFNTEGTMLPEVPCGKSFSFL